jgi:hypothetical protein
MPSVNAKQPMTRPTGWRGSANSLTSVVRRAGKPPRRSGRRWSLLEDVGWPGAAPLESADFQLVNRWRDLLNELARLDLVVPKMTLAHAVGQVSAMAADTVFQPEMDGAVVEVLGPLEAAGVEFDRLWIAGLAASRWPPAGRPMALISRRLQRHYGMPDADPDDTAAYAKRVIDRLRGSARACICSYPRQSGDAIETVTALLTDIAGSADRADPGWHAAQLCGLAIPKLLSSDPVPPVRPDETVVGGAAIIQWQRDEPFTCCEATSFTPLRFTCTAIGRRRPTSAAGSAPSSSNGQRLR